MRKACPSFMMSAILGLIAMWALLLQGTLASAAPDFAPAQGIHCAQDHSEAAPAAPEQGGHQHQCCPAAHVSKLALPTPLASAFRFERHPGTLLVWRISTFLEKTGPPERDHHPRGPPAA